MKGILKKILRSALCGVGITTVMAIVNVFFADRVHRKKAES